MFATSVSLITDKTTNVQADLSLRLCFTVFFPFAWARH